MFLIEIHTKLKSKGGLVTVQQSHSQSTTLVFSTGAVGGRLEIQGHHFHIDGTRVFLSGINQAWVQYGYDFGNDQYRQRKATYEDTLDKVREAGGNSVSEFFNCRLISYKEKKPNKYRRRK